MARSELESEKRAAIGWGTVAAISWIVLLSTVGAEGIADVLTAGLGLALAPEEAAVDTVIGLVALGTTKEWHKHYSLYRHLKKGGTLDTHIHKPIVKDVKLRR